MAQAHTIRTASGGTVTIPNFTQRTAIHAFCSECMGWDAHPNECTSPLCPLYIYRGKFSLVNRKVVAAPQAGGT